MIQVPLYRACALCVHGLSPTHAHATATVSAGDRRCVCPEVTGRKQADWPIAVPVAAARANTGPCGPEATHLEFAGLRP